LDELSSIVEDRVKRLDRFFRSKRRTEKLYEILSDIEVNGNNVYLRGNVEYKFIPPREPVVTRKMYLAALLAGGDERTDKKAEDLASALPEPVERFVDTIDITIHPVGPAVYIYLEEMGVACGPVWNITERIVFFTLQGSLLYATIVSIYSEWHDIIEMGPYKFDSREELVRIVDKVLAVATVDLPPGGEDESVYEEVVEAFYKSGLPRPNP